MSNAVTNYAPVYNGKNLSNEKELVSAISVVGLRDSKMREVVSARCWMGRSRGSSVVYATVWVHGDNQGDNGCAGHGRAGGYGYHKESAAISEALGSAGITLAEAIDGRGESAVHDALRAVALHLGYEGVLIVTHG